MSVHAYVLVETESEHAKLVQDALAAPTFSGSSILGSDTVTGPWDVIVHVEAENWEHLHSVLEASIQAIAGVRRTMTCVAISPA